MNEQMTKVAIAGAILFAVYKFAPKPAAAGALALAAVMVGKQVPYVKDVI